jgi:D-threo-aldose 1-dehydrogenase
MTVHSAGLRPLGRTGLEVTGVCLGTSPLASMPQLYGYAVGADQAEATVAAALAGPFNFIDTSNNYGGGRAERRIGAALAAMGGLPAGVVLATKADADPDSGDFSGARVRRSVAESLDRLGLDRVQLMYLHDPEHHLTFAEAMAPDGPVRALAALRDAGVLGHLGIAAGPVPLLRQFIATGEFEVVLSHNRFTLADRSAEPLMDDAAERGIAYVNAAPYGGGMLAKGPDAQPRYAYRETPESVREAVRGMERACAAAGVPLEAAALQFSLRDPGVTSTVVGISDPARIARTAALAALDIPDSLWPDLRALTPPASAWLG